MRADDLDDALALQNAPEFGLTGGLHSLDPDEIEHWLERVEVGNAYVNRHTTGAIVRRQPFGGWKHSSVGPGAKTGGPNDILRFVRFAPTQRRCDGALRPRRCFASRATSPDCAPRQNVLRYRPLDKVVVRADRDDDRTTSSRSSSRRRALTGVAIEIVDADEPDDALARRIGASGARPAARARPDLRRARPRVPRAPASPSTTPPSPPTARVELPRWLREQAISRTLHRHGRVAGLTSSRRLDRGATIATARSWSSCVRRSGGRAPARRWPRARPGSPVFTCSSASASPVTV